MSIGKKIKVKIQGSVMKNRLGEISNSRDCDTCGAENVKTICTERCIITMRFNKKIPFHVFQCEDCIKNNKTLLDPPKEIEKVYVNESQ